jgi:hypothetical protein
MMNDWPDATLIQHLRDRSRRIFGAEFRAEVGLAVAQADRICKVDLYGRLGSLMADAPSATTVNNEVDLLVDAGLLLPEVPHARNGKKYWKPKQPSAYWTFCEELAR